MAADPDLTTELVDPLLDAATAPTDHLEEEDLEASRVSLSSKWLIIYRSVAVKLLKSFESISLQLTS